MSWNESKIISNLGLKKKKKKRCQVCKIRQQSKVGIKLFQAPCTRSNPTPSLTDEA